MIAEVPHRLDGERADKVVAVLAGLSRTEARRLVEQGAVRRGGVVLAPAERVAAGSVIEFEPMQAEPVPIQRVSYRVILEEPEFLVIAKPAGVTVHPGAGRPGGTLADTLAADWPELVGVGEPGRWGIVHRLDKDTSGLLLIARTAQSHRDLATALAARRIHRSYLALVEGCVDPPRGTVDAPIGRDPGVPTRRAMVSDGKPARTHYRRLAGWDRPSCSLLQVDLETGRTHQIRVHMAGIGHPVAGDRTYGARIDAPRLWLHAWRLAFPHPKTGAAMEIEAPPDTDLVEFLATLGDPDLGQLPFSVTVNR